MRAVVVVLVAPVGDKYLGLEQGVELLDGEQLVADPRAVGLNPRVLPGRAGLDVAGLDGGEPAPVAQRAGSELGPVVAAQVLRAAANCGDLVQDRDGGVGAD